MEFLCSFCRETCCSVAKIWLFSLVTSIVIQFLCTSVTCCCLLEALFNLFLLFRQNSILADEMGLGKTIQSISFLIEMQVSVNPHVGSPISFIHLILWHVEYSLGMFQASCTMVLKFFSCEKIWTINIKTNRRKIFSIAAVWCEGAISGDCTALHNF